MKGGREVRYKQKLKLYILRGRLDEDFTARYGKV